MVTWLERGGIEMWLLGAIGALRPLGIESDICFRGPTAGRLIKEFEAVGASVIQVSQGHLGPFDRRHREAIRSLLLTNNYDAVHSHCGDLSFAFLEEAKTAGVRERLVLYHSAEPHRVETPPAWLRPLILATEPIWQRHCRRRTRAAATHFLGCSEEVAQRIGAPPSAGVLHLGVDTDRFYPGAKQNPPGKRTRVVTVGRLDASKNHATVLNVAALSRERGLPFVFLLAGVGPYREQLEAEATQRGLLNVEFLGQVSDVPKLLSECDFALHPSVLEGLSIAVLEYQASGLPVVASNIPQNLEALAPDLRPFTSNPFDAAQMQKSLEDWLWVDSLERLRSQGRRWVEERFSLAAATAKLAMLYGQKKKISEND